MANSDYKWVATGKDHRGVKQKKQGRMVAYNSAIVKRYIKKSLKEAGYTNIVIVSVSK